jgi:hypothetical protein
MKRRDFLTAGTALCLSGLARGAGAQSPADTDIDPIPAPKDALALFDGKNLDHWVSRNGGGPARWKVEDGYVEVVPGAGDIYTKQTFSDFQLHVEFRVPNMADASGQGKGNSGVYLQGKYEIQVLDSFGIPNPTMGDCGGFYSVAPPLTNACKKAEKWQSYDLYFWAPRFDAGGKLIQPGYVTAYQNDILIHSNRPFEGRITTSGMEGDVTKPGPVLLQDHGNRVRFRNVWLFPMTR